jgi:signal transduction histidine kinase
MLERLERSFHQASRFSADAAHELKTPLTILRGRLEQARRKAGDAVLRDDLSDLLDEVGRLSAITRKLLLLSQADAGKLDLNRSAVKLSELLGEMVADAQMLAEARSLTSSIAPGLIVSGDRVLLQQLLNNLLGNALRYASADGFVDITAIRTSTHAEVVFSNACRPIGPEERSHFFERFQRGDAAHSRGVEGSGLGLSLAREIARAHRGELTLEPGPQTQVRLKLRLPFG